MLGFNYCYTSMQIDRPLRVAVCNKVVAREERNNAARRGSRTWNVKTFRLALYRFRTGYSVRLLW